MAAPKFTTTATRRSTSSGSCQVSIWVLILTSLLVFRLTYTYSTQGLDLLADAGTTADEALFSLLLSPGSQANYILAPKTGKAVALPSIRNEKEDNGDKTDQSRTEHGVLYGGKGDKVHLGGFTDIDLHGISPAAWKFMITFFGIKSLMDVGCGRGISTAWFYLHGVDALCLEGSHDGVLQTILPHPETQIIEHDFSRGPWWPEKTYDAVWCVEFLEHVGRNYHKNYFPAFRKSALIFASHSRWGGWHHVEVHDDKWWISKFAMYGFTYSEEWTLAVREAAQQESNQHILAPNGDVYNAQHVWTTIQVFFNPAVAALPQHAHLLAGPGCYDNTKDGIIFNKECDGKKDTKLPPEFIPLILTEQQDKDWEGLVKKNVKMIETKP